MHVVDDRDDVPAAVADHPVRSLRGPVGEETGGQDGEPFAHAGLTKACTTITVLTPSPFRAVGLWYDDFSQTSDDEVRRLLADAAAS